jgi:hypothetical protein
MNRVLLAVAILFPLAATAKPHYPVVPPLDLISAAGAPVYPVAAATDQQIFQIRDARLAWCGEQYRMKRLRSASSLMQCGYDGYIPALIAADYGAVDLEKQRVLAELAIAERLDRHAISFTEGQQEENRLDAYLQAKLEDRIAEYNRAADQAEAQAQAINRATDEAVTARSQAWQQHLQLCEASGWLAPTRSGSFGESIVNAARARAACEAGEAPPQPAPQSHPIQTICQYFGEQVICNTQ